MIELIETKKVNGYVSPLTLANSYYIISQEINKKIAYEFVHDCLELFTITEINRQNIEEAIENKFKDFEDDLHISIAHQLNIDYVITRNKKDFASGLMPHPIYGWMSWVQILNPTETTFESIVPLIGEAHSNAVIKFNKKTANK